MPGSPTIAISRGAARVRPRARRRAAGAELVLAADQRAVEPAADRGGVRVDAVQQEAAVGQRGRRAPWRTRRQVAASRRISPRAAERASRSAATGASPITTRRRGHASRPRPVPTPSASAPNGSSAPGAARRRGAARATGRPRARAGRRTPPATASPRSSATLPPWRAHARAPRRGERSSSALQRLRVRDPPPASRETRTSRAGARRAATRPCACGARRGGTSWRRIAASSARSSGDGSMPSPSTSASYALR